MITLADEIVAALPRLMTDALGPRLTAIVSALSADWPSVRRAAFQLHGEGRAKVARRGRAFHLLPADDPTPVCAICHAVFEQDRYPCRHKKTCSRSCSRRLAWSKPGAREIQSAKLKKIKNTPAAKARASKVHSERCSDPEFRKKMVENTKRSWADPERRAKRLMSIKAAWKDNQKRVAKASRLKKRMWKDPEFREKTIAGMRNSPRAAVRRKIVELAAANPNLPHWAIGEIVGRSAETVAAVLRRARKDGVIGPRPGDGPRLAMKAAA